jgi:hypothetical protein
LSRRGPLVKHISIWICVNTSDAETLLGGQPLIG